MNKLIVVAYLNSLVVATLAGLVQINMYVNVPKPTINQIGVNSSQQFTFTKWSGSSMNFVCTKTATTPVTSLLVLYQTTATSNQVLDAYYPDSTTVPACFIPFNWKASFVNYTYDPNSVTPRFTRVDDWLPDYCGGNYTFPNDRGCTRYYDSLNYYITKANRGELPMALYLELLTLPPSGTPTSSSTPSVSGAPVKPAAPGGVGGTAPNGTPSSGAKRSAWFLWPFDQE